jgi:hypothetical protein
MLIPMITLVSGIGVGAGYIALKKKEKFDKEFKDLSNWLTYDLK